MNPSAESQGFTKLMEIATVLALPSALNAVMQLNVIEILAEHAGDHLQESQFLSAAEIVAHVDAFKTASTAQRAQAASTLDRMLRLLASHGVLASAQHSDPLHGHPITTYALNPTSLLLTQQQQAISGSLAPAVQLSQDPVLWNCHRACYECILDGEVPFVKAFGMKSFCYISKDARFSDLFNRTMEGHSRLIMHGLLETYPGFKDVATLVDVGGGIGACLGMITAKHPHIKGINFDLPHVVGNAMQYPGVEHVGGNMFEAIPKADAIFMKCVLHDWSDAKCLKILENCYKALPSGGKVIIVDIVLPDEVGHEMEARVGYQMDIQMFAFNEGAKERTHREVEAILRAAGFATMKLICKVHGHGVIEAHKN